jgi:hypothetical protein
LEDDDDVYTTHHIILDDRGSHFAMHGPYCKSMLSAFVVKAGDVVTLDWDKDKDIFNISLHSSTSKEKFWIRIPGNFLLKLI